ncbi:MAG: hypothetical protein ACI9VS_003603 [Candidatus Binatia bacterium]|jgi:hypothetical protein
MSQLTKLLKIGADEAREFSQSSPDAEFFGEAWIESLARRKEVASLLDNNASVEREIDSIFHSIVDCGPAGEGFAPSFLQAVDGLQRSRKRSGKRR